MPTSTTEFIGKLLQLRALFEQRRRKYHLPGEHDQERHAGNGEWLQGQIGDNWAFRRRNIPALRMPDGKIISGDKDTPDHFSVARKHGFSFTSSWPPQPNEPVRGWHPPGKPELFITTDELEQMARERANNPPPPPMTKKKRKRKFAYASSARVNGYRLALMGFDFLPGQLPAARQRFKAYLQRQGMAVTDAELEQLQHSWDLAVFHLPGEHEQQRHAGDDTKITSLDRVKARLGAEVAGEGKDGNEIDMRIQTDPDLDLLATRGQFIEADGAIYVKGQPHSCHGNTAQLYRQGKIDHVVTGYAGMNGERPVYNKEGRPIWDEAKGKYKSENAWIWYQHSWGLKDGKVVETTSKFNRYFGVVLTPDESKQFTAAYYGKNKRNPGEKE